MQICCTDKKKKHFKDQNYCKKIKSGLDDLGLEGTVQNNLP